MLNARLAQEMADYVFELNKLIDGLETFEMEYVNDQGNGGGQSRIQNARFKAEQAKEELFILAERHGLVVDQCDQCGTRYIWMPDKNNHVC